MEESGIERRSLKLLYSGSVMVTQSRSGTMWPNRIFIFRSGTGRVRLDYENAGYRWSTIRQIEKEINYTNIFINERSLIRKIRRYIDAKDY